MNIRIKTKVVVALVFMSCVVRQTTEASDLVKRCPLGWIENLKHGFCYYESSEAVDFSTAVKRCADMSSTLISIVSKEEHAFLISTLFKNKNAKINPMSRGCPEYWIGLSIDDLQSNISRTWSWIDGTPYFNRTTFWYTDHPSGDYDCAELHLQWQGAILTGRYRDEHCSRSIRYLCKMALKTSCPFGFTYVPEAKSCYSVIYDRLNWTKAGQQCGAMHPDAHLAIVTSAKENSAIAGYLDAELRGDGNHTCYHPGWDKFGPMLWLAGERTLPGRCDSPFVWKPCPGRAVPFDYSRWHGWEPNCVYNEEACVSLWVQKSYNWNDVPCFLNICSLCEYDPWMNFQ